MAIFNTVYGGEIINFATRWPSPSGFHVPLTDEWKWLKTIMASLSLTTWNNWIINLHIPFAGYITDLTAQFRSKGSYGGYWSSSPSGSDYPNKSLFFYLNSSSVGADSSNNRAYGLSVRCFKNSFVVPTSSWTVINGTLWGAWIFRNQTEWIISITSDWTTGYTIQDKNLWATTVYNYGDTLSATNCGNLYQWWNNYGFTWWVDPSNTSTTVVDASGYGPGNYYNSSTFITVSGDWSSVHTDNLRWWEDGNVPV